MKSALNTETYNFNDISVAIRRRVISQRFLVVVVVIIAFFVVADVVVVALVVTVIFFFPCGMGLPPAIPGLSVEKRVPPGKRRRGRIAVPALTLTGLQYEEIKRIFARVRREPCPDVIIFIKKMSSERGRGSEGCRREDLAPCLVTPIRYRGYPIACSIYCCLSPASSVIMLGDARTPYAIPSWDLCYTRGGARRGAQLQELLSDG